MKKNNKRSFYAVLSGAGVVVVSVFAASCSLFGAPAPEETVLGQPLNTTTEPTQNETTAAAHTQTPPLSAPETKPDVQLPEGEYGQLIASYIGGSIAEMRQDLATAKNYYTRALYFDSTNLDLVERTFQSSLATGDLQTARVMARALLSLESAPLVVKILQAMDLAHEEDYTQAQQVLNGLVKQAPGMLMFHLMKAYVDLAAGDAAASVAARLEALPVNQYMDGYRHFHLGRLHEMAGDLVKAQAEYQLAFDYDKNSIFTVVALGRVLQQQNKPEEAQKVYDSFEKANPESLLLLPTLQQMAAGEKPAALTFDVHQSLAQVVFGFATLMVTQEMDTAALQLLNIANMLDHTYPYTDFYKAVLTEQNGNLATAADMYAAIQPSAPTFLAAQARLAETLFDMGENKRAEGLARMEKLVDDNPQVVQLQRTLAQMFYESGRYGQAVALYSKLIHPDLSQRTKAIYLFARGASHERMGALAQAESDLTASLEIEPNNPIALNYLGYMWIDAEKNIDRGLVYITKALLLRPDDGAIIDSLGWGFYKKGEYEKALVLLEKAAELRPDDPVIVEHLGDVYAKLGRTDNAVIQWKRALSMELDVTQTEEKLRHKINTATAASVQ